jgi:hypothetical protein
MANKINEDLERFKSLMGYDPTKGMITEKVGPNRSAYFGESEMLNEADPEEEQKPAEEENPDFDFGDTGNPEDAATAEEGGDEMPAEGGDTEETEDEFGTANEFSAVDDLEDAGDSEVEEIDVTSIVSKSDEAREMAQQAVSVGQENMSYLKALTDKLSNLESQLTKMDSIASKITKLEQDIKTPEEKLELRSLDSYPFNMKLSDYWSEKAAQNKHYDISGGESNVDGREVEYKITPEDVDDFNDVDIKKSFVPESRNKRKILKNR